MTSSPTRSFRILVVDDTPAIHADYRKILARVDAQADAELESLEAALFDDIPSVASSSVPAARFDIASAMQGRDALALVRAAHDEGRPFAVAFVDMRMPPGWDGLETIERLWEVDPTLQVVICSAYSDHSWHALHARLGERDGLLILRKPFDTTEVLQCAHALTRKWETARALAAHLETLESAVQARTLELHRSEEQLRQIQKLEAIGQLAGGVAHDFNNLLAVIQANVESLEEQAGETTEEVRDIGDAVARGARLVRQLLAFGKNQPRQPTIVAANALLVDLDRMLRRVVGEDVVMAQVLGRDLATMRADIAQLEQVVVNLVVNARDAMPAGGELTIETANAVVDPARATALGMRAGRYVTIAVTDTGTGMDEATRARIFEPFFTTKPVGRGTGLGLATVFGIVTQDGGGIEVESALGRGSTFRVYLPALDDRVAELAARRVRPPRRCAGESILLVEDDDQVRAALGRLLAVWGYRCHVASNGNDALEMLRDRGVSDVRLVLTDAVMPGMDGRTLGLHVRTLRPELKVLLMSGYASHPAVKAEAAPGEFFIAKPFVATTLSAAIREALDA